MRSPNGDHGAPPDLAPVLGARRDGTANADTSRGLAMTLLGEFVLPTGGSAWTQTLIAGLDLLGVQEKAARQTLARMETAGWLDRERVGRRTRWSLSTRTERLLTEGANRIYNFGHADRAWNGEWVVLLASVPERERAARYRMAQRLSWIGFGPLGNGTWICPWTDHEAGAHAVVTELGVDATSFRGAVGLIGAGDALAQQAWPLDELASAYDDFLADFPVEPGNPIGADCARHLSHLVHRWRRFPLLDPDLPIELLPHDWPGREAAARFARLRAAWHEPARTWWQELETDGNG